MNKELLDKTGGIIQGMSGSPIIQNNKFMIQYIYSKIIISGGK